LKKSLLITLALILALALALTSCSSAEKADEHDHEHEHGESNLEVLTGEEAVWNKDYLGGLEQPEGTTISSIILNTGVCGVLLEGLTFESAKAFADDAIKAGFASITNESSEESYIFFGMKEEDTSNIMVTYLAESGEATITYTDSFASDVSEEVEQEISKAFENKEEE